MNVLKNKCEHSMYNEMDCYLKMFFLRKVTKCKYIDFFLTQGR